MNVEVSSIGKMIKLLRQLRGLRQIELAHLIGTCQSSIALIEQDNLVPSKNLLSKLEIAIDAQILGEIHVHITIKS